jgi:hypothetical protein
MMLLLRGQGFIQSMISHAWSGHGSPGDKGVVELSWKEGNQSAGKLRQTWKEGNTKGDVIRYNEQKINVCTRNFSEVMPLRACQWNFEV